MKAISRGLERLSAVLGRPTTVIVENATFCVVPPGQWEAAVGRKIAARAKPLRIERGILWVRAATSTWAHELDLLAPALLAQLKLAGVEAQSLRFVVGPVDPIATSPRRAQKRRMATEAQLPAEVTVELRKVDNSELREAIRVAAAKSLGLVRNPTR